MIAALDVVSHVWRRDRTIQFRNKTGLVAAIVTPVAWLAVVGSLPIHMEGIRYLDYVAPAIVVMSVLFPCLQGGLLTSSDRQLGHLKKAFATPAPRYLMAIGKTLAASTKAFLQFGAVLLTAVLLGVKFSGGLAGFLVILVYTMCIALGLSALSVSIAFVVGDMHAFGSTMSLISLPLFMGSSALMPIDKMPCWLASFARVNPLTYAIGATRDIMLSGDTSNAVWGICLACVFLVAAMSLCAYLFERDN
ncbi:MAG: ABC transporter permease [Actinomycetota bacterium]|nr:ABC transporter permease [Actinomycetota bacterium]